MRLLQHFQERFGFTRTELMVVMLLTSSLLIGTAIRQFRDKPAAAHTFSYTAVDSQFVRGARAFHDAVSHQNRPVRDTANVLPASPLDLNRAGERDLIRLPGVGPAIARRILAYRQAHGRFTSVQELRHVRGIGPRTLERIRPHLRVVPHRR